MSNYAYVAVDADGAELQGTLEVSDQLEALSRIRQMGLFPTRIFPADTRRNLPRRNGSRLTSRLGKMPVPLLGGRVKPTKLAIFTRQLATLIEAGMPLVRGLRILQQQEENRVLKQVILDVATRVESGNTLTEAVEAHPRIFNRLYVNMVKAGEVGGALDKTLSRLAEFLEKAEKIKGKVKAAMFYPAAVLFVAAGVMSLLMLYVIPRFRGVFEGLGGAAGLPTFTVFIFKVSELLKHHALAMAGWIAAFMIGFALAKRTGWGRLAFDHVKLRLPIVGSLFRKVAISRFSRTLGTLVGNGVPILQALTIVKETAGNAVVGGLVSTIHENVKQGDAIASTLKGSRVFPAMVTGMVDVGEQTGALPEMLMKIADTYDDEVDNATSALTSLLEPIMIVFLAIVVGSIVIAMFLPILRLPDIVGGSGSSGSGE